MPRKNRPSYVAVWGYQVKPGAEERLMRLYGPRGAWVRLFRRAKGYRGTLLLRHAKTGRRFVTLDFWDSPAAFERFRKQHAEEYAAVDQQGERLTQRETPGGWFLCLSARSFRP